MKIFAPLAELASANALKRQSLKALLTPSTLISASNAVHAQTFVLAKQSAWSSQIICLTTKKGGCVKSDAPSFFCKKSPNIGGLGLCCVKDFCIFAP